jgi:uncharacterized protein YgbK (DUF1537 family)
MIYAILADDSTGAADAGVEFAQAGWRTRSLRHDWQAHHLAGAEMIVIDTSSRTTEIETARTAVHQAVTRLRQVGSEVVYKKIDSTLRGALGVELDAVLTACGQSLAVVSPAFPAAGRTLVDGVLRVDGVPVAHTPAGRDPRTPVYESHLPTLLSGQSQRRVHHFPRPPGGFDPTALAAQWRKLPPASLAVVDAADESDLAQIAAAAGFHPRGELLLCGSAGLARPWARRLAQRIRRQVLVICGSLHPLARQQLHALQQQGGSLAFTLLATPEGLPSHAATHQAAQTLAAEAVGWLAQHAVSAVIVIGGDTLEALLAAAGANGIDLEQPFFGGMALGRIAGGPWAGLRIASKAGGFGQEDTILHAAGYLCGNQE